MPFKQNLIQLRGDDLFKALASDKMTQAAVEALWLAAQIWVSSGGKVSINRFLRLPTTGPALTRAGRDFWLRRAAEGLPQATKYALAYALQKELENFMTRGPWSIWKHSNHPPPEASELRKALFHVVKFSHEKLIEQRQIYRILSES